MKIFLKEPKESIVLRLKASPSAKARHPNIPQKITSVKAAKLVSLLMTIFGVCCMLFTEHMYRILPFALGVAMCILGLLEVWIGWRTEEYREEETKLTSNGIVFIILGCVILWNHANADFIIGAIWGVLSLVKGSEELNQVFYRILHKTPYILKLIHCCTELLLGFILLLDPTAAIKNHVFILGIELSIVSLQIMQEIRNPR